MSRDPDYEAEFFRQSERQAGLMGNGFPDAVAARLEWAQGVHGDRWRDMGCRRLLAEIREEGVDAAAWAVLLAQLLMIEEPESERSLEARLKLQEIAAHGARVSFLVGELVEILSD